MAWLPPPPAIAPAANAAAAGFWEKQYAQHCVPRHQHTAYARSHAGAADTQHAQRREPSYAWEM